MKPERKKEIRSLVHTVPTLIKAHMVNQAFETEKVIAATFDLSDQFLEIVGGKIPQNHIEKVQEVYSDLMYKSFNVGLKSGEVKAKSVSLDKNLSGPQLDHELEIKMPMYFGVKQDLMLMFKEQLGDILDTVPDIKENLALQFEKDVEGAYREGLKEFLSLDAPVENNNDEVLDEGADVVDEDDVEIEVDLDDDLDELDEENEENDGNEEEEEEDESALQEDLDMSFESAEEEHVKATVVASALDATAATALKVWEAYASEDLKELFKEQSKAGLHRDNAQMVQGLSDWLVKGNKAEFYIPFESNVVSNEVDKSVLNRLEQYAKLLKNSTAEKVLRYSLGLPVGKKAKASVVSAEDKSIANKLEAYTKLLKNPMAEKVLRYTLGLPVKKVSASVSENMVGTYHPEMLRNKIISSIKSHKIEAGINDFETIIVDCVVSGINKMSEAKALRMLEKALDIKASNMNAFDVKADVLAQKLDDALQLPGDIVFVNIDGDYCLTYNMKPEDVSRIQGSTKKKSNLTNSDKSQIEALSRLSKSKTIRDIQRASEKASAHLKKILSDIRFGKVGIAEGSSKLRASLEDVVADVFGAEGINYYKQLKRN
jgi:hypothetical protein